MASIAWDFERIGELSDQLNSCINQLEQLEKDLKQLRNEAMGSWSSSAGDQYAERLGEDIRTTQSALKAFRAAKEQLAQTVKTYAGGELEIGNRLNACYAGLHWKHWR